MVLDSTFHTTYKRGSPGKLTKITQLAHSQEYCSAHFILWNVINLSPGDFNEKNSPEIQSTQCELSVPYFRFIVHLRSVFQKGRLVVRGPPAKPTLPSHQKFIN